MQLIVNWMYFNKTLNIIFKTNYKLINLLLQFNKLKFKIIIKLNHQ